MHNENTFITLTYNDEHIPEDGSLNLVHLQQFMKRLRKKYSPKTIRFFGCGEYGSKTHRPHYHALLFNHEFNDQRLHQERKCGPIFTSEQLLELWPWGFSSTAAATFQSASYVARYILKKVNGPNRKDHYTWVDPTTGEVHTVAPEFITMSTKPGIGRSWYDKFKTDIYPADFCVINGKKYKPPEYYDELYAAENPKGFLKIKRQRVASLAKHADNNTPERLAVREQVLIARTSNLRRDLE